MSKVTLYLIYLRFYWIIILTGMGIATILMICGFIFWSLASNYLSKNYPDKWPFRWYYPAGTISWDEVKKLKIKYPDWYSQEWWRLWKKLPCELEKDIVFMKIWSKHRMFVLCTVISSIVTIIIMLIYPLLLIAKRF